MLTTQRLPSAGGGQSGSAQAGLVVTYPKTGDAAGLAS